MSGSTFRSRRPGLVAAVGATLLLAGLGSCSSWGARPSASVTSRAEWAADAERPSSLEWASSSCASPRRFGRVRAPVAQGGWAYRFEVHDGDDSYGERCELAQGNPTRRGFPTFQAGDDVWIAWQLYLPRGYPSGSRYSTKIAQWKQTALPGRDPQAYSGVPVLSLETRDGRFGLLNSTTSSVGGTLVWLWRGPARQRRWVRFTMHVRFSPDPRVGFVELYGNLGRGRERLLMPRRFTWTMKQDARGPIPSHARIGIYRAEQISGTERLYYDGYAVAPTRRRAELAAFAPRAAGARGG
jgi:hypothetical protein